MVEAGNILIVDDLPENLCVLGRILKDAGHRVRATLSGKLALNAVELDPPEIVLLDVMMPEMDGYEVCRRLKANPLTADIPVLFVSALSDPADKVLCFEVGCVDFITKPYDKREVLVRVQTHTALSRTRRQLEEQKHLAEQTLADLEVAQSQLVSTAKMVSLGVLTAGIAHELNNPINFVSANAQTCLKLLGQLEGVYDLYDTLSADNFVDKLLEVETQKTKIDYPTCRDGLHELLRGIQVGANRTANIVRGLRLFSREGASGQFTVFNLHENIETALLMLGNKLGKKITVEQDFLAVPSVIGQPGGLNQVFVNLISNALDAIYEKPEPHNGEKIIIRTREAKYDGKPAVFIEIADSGLGMSEEIRAHLFEPFYTTKEVGSGMGLGLSIAYGIVRGHGGWLEVENVSEGGTLFRVVLPRKTDYASKEGEQHE